MEREAVCETWEEQFSQLLRDADLTRDAAEEGFPFAHSGDIDLDTVVGLDGVSVRGHRDLLSTIESDLRRLEAARAAVLASVERQGHHLVDGHRGPAAWLRATTDASPAMSHRLVARARLLAREPLLDTSLRSGRISVEHVDIVAHYAQPEYAADNLTDYLPALLDAADNLPFDDFVLVVRHWQLTVDPGAELDADERAHANRRFRLRRRQDGSWSASGDLASVDGVVLDETFQRFLAAETDADWRAARELKGDLATSADLPRSLDQRRADALMAMVHHAARPDAGTTPEPLVNLVVDVETLHDAMDDAPDPGDAPSWTGQHRHARTASGHPVHPRHILHAVLVGKVRLVVLDGAGRITHVGRTERYFTPAVRDSVAALHRRCRHPGCTGERVQTDHVDPWSAGGASDPDNAAPLCGFHNRWHHVSGYRTRLDADGIWRTTRPDGTEMRDI